MRVIRALLLMPAAALLAACGDDNGTGPTLGRAEAYLGDDPSTTLALSRGGSPSLGSAATQAFTGSLAGAVKVEISADGETWVDLGSLNGITVELQSADDSSTAHGEVDVPVGTYNRIRLTLSEAQARLDAGSTFGNLTLSAQVDVALGGADDEVVIVETVESFTVSADARAVITIDLNAEAWITDQAVAAQSATDATIIAAVRMGASAD